MSMRNRPGRPRPLMRLRVPGTTPPRFRVLASTVLLLGVGADPALARQALEPRTRAAVTAPRSPSPSGTTPDKSRSPPPPSYCAGPMRSGGPCANPWMPAVSCSSAFPRTPPGHAMGRVRRRFERGSERCPRAGIRAPGGTPSPPRGDQDGPPHRPGARCPDPPAGGRGRGLRSRPRPRGFKQSNGPLHRERAARRRTRTLGPTPRLRPAHARGLGQAGCHDGGRDRSDGGSRGTGAAGGDGGAAAPPGDQGVLREKVLG